MFSPDLNQIWSFSIIFIEVPNITLHVNPSRGKPRLCIRTNGRTVTKKLIGAFRDCDNAPKVKFTWQIFVSTTYVPTLIEIRLLVSAVKSCGQTLWQSWHQHRAFISFASCKEFLTYLHCVTHNIDPVLRLILHCCTDCRGSLRVAL
jgi:hypothetical protein